MSYQAIDSLTNDADFSARNRACATQQAEIFRNDARPDFVAVADEVLRGSAELALAFTRISAAAPGIADKADDGNGGIDQALVTDADLLSLVQANWQVVASLYFNEDGTPKGT
jgi:hypothetical protein